MTVQHEQSDRAKQLPWAKPAPVSEWWLVIAAVVIAVVGLSL